MGKNQDTLVGHLGVRRSRTLPLLDVNWHERPTDAALQAPPLSTTRPDLQVPHEADAVRLRPPRLVVHALRPRREALLDEGLVHGRISSPCHGRAVTVCQTHLPLHLVAIRWDLIKAVATGRLRVLLDRHGCQGRQQGSV